MKSTVSAFIAASLDGFIARKDGALDWLDKANEVAPKEEDCGYKAFMSSIDALVMGRNTFEKVLSFNCPWPYAGTPVVVLSSKNLTIPEELKNSVSQASSSPESILKNLADKGLRRIYVDGANTIQRFLAAEKIDRITITVVPVLIGEGISLFGALNKDISLTLKNSQFYDFGFVQLTYHIDNSKG
jgi:dihydrofolate reductase